MREVGILNLRSAVCKVRATMVAPTLDLSRRRLPPRTDVFQRLVREAEYFDFIFNYMFCS